MLLRRGHDFHPHITQERWRRSENFLVLGKNFKHEDEGASPKMAKRLLQALGEPAEIEA